MPTRTHATALLLTITTVAAALLLTRAWTARAHAFSLDTPLAEVLLTLGESPPDHQLPATRRRELEGNGRDIFFEGRTVLDGEETKFQSLYFRCIDCHLVAREDPDLSVSDPEARLAYLRAKELPLVPGTTLHGTVNKTSWYNGSWREGRYRDLVTSERYAADRSLRGALRLCSEVCSQGRELSTTEIDALLAFLWSKELRLADLELAPNLTVATRGGESVVELSTSDIPTIKRLYRQASPGTIEETPAGGLSAGDPDSGRAVFQQACLNCHAPGRPGKEIMFNTPSGLSELPDLVEMGMFDTAVRESVPPPSHGQGVYMPEYTLERLSHRQVADLKAYAAAPVGATSLRPVLAPLPLTAERAGVVTRGIERTVAPHSL